MTTGLPHRSLHVGPDVVPDAESWRLSIDGLVGEPLSFRREDLLDLPHDVADSSAVACPDQSNLAGAMFEGVPLAHLVALAKPKSEANYVAVHAGPYAVAFRLDSLDRRHALVAVRRNGVLIEPADGGPGRLVVTSGACFDTVKWVHRVSLEADGSAATAAEIVRRRHEARLAAEGS